VPALGGGPPRAFAILGLTAVLMLLNYRRLTVVGWVAICLGVFSVLPFFVMGLISLPKIRPARWMVVDLHDVDWNLYLNCSGTSTTGARSARRPEKCRTLGLGRVCMQAGRSAALRPTAA
jgi:hypothetical protein